MAHASISILAVDDEVNFLEIVQTLLPADHYGVETASDGAAAINKLQSKMYDLVLLDITMPRVDGIEVLKFIKDRYLDTQVVMLTGDSDIRLAVKCMQLGAYTYLTKPHSAEELLATIDRALERKRLTIENKALKTELARHALSPDLIGTSKPFLEVLKLCTKIAPTDSAVLIQGPSGTGKELIASFLHKNSLRKDHPFVALNCASIPETLIESELFGHEKGAFTDAIATKQGLVEIANRGTLFLDEIGEISQMMQPKLLRLLQTGEYRRVGGNKNLNTDIRIISATNRNLRSEVVAGRFREDLLYRLNVITLSLPPLRDRREDIPLLVDHFLRERLQTKEQVRIDSKALDLLTKYDWPGNVRELENVIERAAILCQNNTIRIDDLALPIGIRPVMESRGAAAGDALLGSEVSMREVEKAHIDGVLKTVSWNKNTAAKILGISLKTLYTKIQQYNLIKE